MMKSTSKDSRAATDDEMSDIKGKPS